MKTRSDELVVIPLFAWRALLDRPTPLLAMAIFCQEFSDMLEVVIAISIEVMASNTMFVRRAQNTFLLVILLYQQGSAFRFHRLFSTVVTFLRLCGFFVDSLTYFQIVNKIAMQF